MDSTIILLVQHRIAVSVMAVALVLLGGVFARRTGFSLSAKRGGVIVGGNNNGSIETGKSESSILDRVIAVIGLIVTVLSVVVATIAWLYPKTPS